MNLDFSNIADQKKAQVYLDKLIKDQSKAELIKVSKKRTSSQNRYVHALFTIFGGAFGFSSDEAKIIVKRDLGYTYVNQGETFLMQTRSMDTVKLTIFIDKFRNYSSANGCYLPTPEEFSENYVVMMQQIEAIESQQNRYSY